MAHRSTTTTSGSCLGRTCLKWDVNGELTALDLALVMERLALVDADQATLRQTPGSANGWSSLEPRHF
ncbi:hypothetical protein [Cyanobium sp. NIES-981]|uniref:hypothetical protein n=1 Tax=Cyanobium sp. NIES-981 TaxID=1851505 RepID=UPI0007DE0C2F|nr:hypothetical protein [Cyanobium sp. NIES-981]SBO43395.1 protein of unknown function [Cyanobium sp. NIES-981]